MYTIVTGAAGFIGANIVKALNERGATKIIAVDNLRRAEKFKNLVDCEVADYLDKEDFLARLDFRKRLQPGRPPQSGKPVTTGRRRFGNRFDHRIPDAAAGALALPFRRRSAALGTGKNRLRLGHSVLQTSITGTRGASAQNNS